jgi:DNA-binding NarL/FixJ family response regulator
MTPSFERKDDAERLLLTERERQIAALVRTGVSNKEIARQSGLREGTIKSHVHNIFRKLGVRSRIELIRRLTL